MVDRLEEVTSGLKRYLGNAKAAVGGAGATAAAGGVGAAVAVPASSAALVYADGASPSSVTAGCREGTT